MDFNDIFNRSQQETQIITFLNNFQTTPLNIKRNIYIQGPHGIGKSTFIMKLLHKLQYDIIRYDPIDIKNTPLIESLSTSTTFSNNVLNKFKKTTTPVVILLDDIDSINASDKSLITSLIKLIRPKKIKNKNKNHITQRPLSVLEICVLINN